MTYDPLTAYPDFYYNPVITHLASYPLWTVSDANKRPLDVVHFASTGGRSQPRGASHRDSRCLMTLPQLIQTFPRHANCAFYVNTQVAPYWVLDIEKTCPPDLRDKLLSIPALFRETSMSGKGYHLVLPAPKNLHLFPTAARKTVLRHPKGYYEVLQAHFVTFTRNTLPEPAGEPLTTWEEIYADLANSARTSVTFDLQTSTQRPDIDQATRDFVFDRFRSYPYQKSLADFHEDNSRYEFGFLGHHYRRLASMVSYPNQQGVPDVQALSSLTIDQQAWLLFDYATDTIAARPKHQEKRNNLPLLLNAAYQVINSTLASKKKKKHAARRKPTPVGSFFGLKA